MNKIERLVSIVNSDILMAMVSEVNSWDNSLEHLEYFSMDDFNDFMDGFSPMDIANRIHFGDFNPNHEYFKFNAYANLESATDWMIEDELNWYKEDIVKRFIELYEDGHVDSWHQEVLDILDSEEEEEEEEEA